MKIIVHAPPYMASLAADLAASEFANGSFEDGSVIGIVRGKHAFTIKRTKSGVTVWHFLTNGGVPSADWEAV